LYLCIVLIIIIPNNLNIMEKDLFHLDVDPSYYLVCFNKECPQCGECLRYAAGAEISKKRTMGLTVYPSALQDGKCRYYRTSEKVELAWGLNAMHAHIPHHLHATVRRKITAYLGSVGTYYRYHDGTRKLSPAQQEDIKKMLADMGCPVERPFDHYITSYDIT